LPSTLGGLRNLKILDLRKNQLVSVPSEISQLRQLETLVLGENNLSEPIFTELGQMKSLVNLDLHSNSLSGSFPSEIGLLTNLQILDLSSNRLEGPIPTQIGRLSLLNELALQRNRLDGSLPTELGLLSELQSIRVEENSLSGEVSDTICSTFERSLTVFALDCGSGNGSTEIECPPQACCTICCTDGMGCACEYDGTGLDFLCKSL
jgi:Leucine-rich repeat (LRR) protein